MLGLAAVARVIVSGKMCRERLKNRTVIQPGSREFRVANQSTQLN